MSKELRKIRIGKVISTKMENTAVVSYQWKLTHPIYKKKVRKTTKFYAHDNQNSCRIGDTVKIEEVRPISKQKRWRVLEILARKEVVELKPIDIDESPSSETVSDPTNVEAEPLSGLTVEIETPSHDGDEFDGKAAIKTKAEPKVKIEPQSKTETKPEPKAKAKVKTEPKSKARKEPKSNKQAEPGNEKTLDKPLTNDSTDIELGQGSK